MQEIPGDLKFLKSHEWARVEDKGTVTVGISDGRVTEVIDGDLKEGENVIVSIAGQNPNQQRGGQGQRGFRIL